MLDKITTRERGVILIAFVALVTGLFYFQYYQPLQLEKLKLTEEVEQKRFQYQQSMGLIRRRLPEIKEATSQLEVEYQILLEQFPRQKEITVFLLEIEGLAKEQGIKLDYFSPKKMQEQGDFYRLPIHIAFFSTYQKMVAYFYTLEESPKMIEIADFDVKVPIQQKAQELQVNMTLHIYIVKDQVEFE